MTVRHFIKSTLSKKYILPGMTAALFLFPTTYASSQTLDINRSFSKKVFGDDAWIFGDLANEFAKQTDKVIEARINNFFKEQVIDRLIGVAEVRLGKKLGKDFTDAFVAIPIFSIIYSAVAEKGPSESQLMVRILLEKMEANKKEILESVDKTYQDDTEALLNTLIVIMRDYSAMGDRYAEQEYYRLPDYIYDSLLVKKRIEQRDESSISNAHYYFLISGLHIEIQKAYQKYKVINNNPGAADSLIQSEFDTEFKSAMDVMLDDGLNYLTNSSLGSLDAWRKEYQDAFSKAKDIKDEGIVPENETTPYLHPSHNPRTKYYSYTMNGNKVKLQVASSRKCGSGCGHVWVYDSFGRLAGGFKPGRGKNAVLHGVSKIAEKIIASHKEDPEGFDTYLKGGYGPIKTMFDTWWDTNKSYDRPKSEVDEYIEESIPSKYQSACALSGKEGKVMKKEGRGFNWNHYMRNAANSCYPCGVVGGRYSKPRRGSPGGGYGTLSCALNKAPRPTS